MDEHLHAARLGSLGDANGRLEARSPREALPVAHRLAWIADDALWLRMLDDRNRTTHIYNEAIAQETFAWLGAYAAAHGVTMTT